MPPSGERRARRLWIPLAIYAAVTFVLPLARRADRREGFWEHATITLLVPAAIVLAWIGMAGAIRAAWSRRWRPRPLGHPAGRLADKSSAKPAPRPRSSATHFTVYGSPRRR